MASSDELVMLISMFTPALESATVSAIYHDLGRDLSRAIDQCLVLSGESPSGSGAGPRGGRAGDRVPSSSITTLPEDIMQQILAQLTLADRAHLARTCRAMRFSVLSVNALIESVDLRRKAIVGYTAWDEAKVASFLHGFPHVRSVSLRGLPIASLRKLPALPEVLDIDLSRTALRDDDLVDLARVFPAVTRLQLSGCDLSDGALHHLAQLENLQSLSLLQVPALTDSSCAFLSEHIEHLGYVDMSECRISDDGVGLLLSRVVEHLSLSLCRQLHRIDAASEYLHTLRLHKCQGLHHVTVCGSALVNITVTNCAILTHVTVTAPLLESLDVSHCKNLTELVCDPEPITHLSVNQCGNLSQSAMTSILKRTHRLEQLLSVGCHQLHDIDATLRHARRVDMSGCSALRRLALRVPVSCDVTTNGCRLLSKEMTFIERLPLEPVE